MNLLGKLLFLCFCMLFWGCTYERAEETILAYHANGIKKTSIWVYPDGEILKRNEWYNDGIKELEIPYKDNVPHGEFQRWTGFGDLVMVGEYKKGLRHGKWTSYFGGHFNKKKEAERYYKEDHAVGDWIGWHHNGEKAFEEHYSENGDSVGIWKKWNDQGILIEENSCFKSNKNGFLKKYASNCKIKESYECIAGNKQGHYKLYYESFSPVDSTEKKCSSAKIREEGHSGNGQQMHPEIFYRADGSIMKKVEYQEGSSIRKNIQWFDGQENLLRESIYRESSQEGYEGQSYGLCEGTTNLFCAETSYVNFNVPSGNLDSSTLSQKEAFSQSIGKNKASLRYIKSDHKLLYEEFWILDSNSTDESPALFASRSFYPDSLGGRMASEGFWSNGKRDGIWRNWYSSGILRDSLTYINGERIGEQFSYDSTGKLTIHKTENGKNRPVIMHIPQ